MIEHRRFPRVPCHLDASVRDLDRSAEAASFDELRHQAMNAKVCNISQGGFCITSSKPPSVGSILRIEVPLPGLPHVTAFGEARWAQGDYGGFKFLALSEDGGLALRRYLAHEHTQH